MGVKSLGSDKRVDLSPEVADEIKTTTCYMCACRCGIKVYLKDGQVRYIEGNPDHPVNKGILCGKGSAGIMNQYSPARLTNPLLRVGERGSGEFKEISWDEAMELATSWIAPIRKTNPAKLALFTGRDQSQSFTGWWASQFGTNNFAAHGGFCSVNMAGGGLYTIGGAFWEFGEPDWEHTKYLMMFGVAEDHDSNPIKAGIGKLKTREDAKFVSINPARTGYSAVADEWVGIRPGTDGLFVLSLAHELLRSENVDFNFLGRYSNAPWLVIQNPGGADDGLFLRDADGNPLCFDKDKGKATSAMSGDINPSLVGEQVIDGTKCIPVFELMAKRYMSKKYAPENVAKQTGIPAEQIKRIAAELAHVAFKEEITIDTPWTDVWGRKHDKMVGRPVSMHAMRGISAHSNGFHTCRAIHVLQILLGSIDVPGGWLYKSPFPKHMPPNPKPAPFNSEPNTPLKGPPLGLTSGPEDLLVGDDGQPLRIDKAFSWEYPMSAHGMMHMVLHNAWAQDPYKVDVLFMYMANMGWNSSMNVPDTLKYMTDKDENGEYKIPKIIYSDAFYSETVPYADLILPDTTYLERWDCISLLDRPISNAHGPGDSIRQPVVEPDRNVRPFQDVMLDLGVRLGLPGMTNDDKSAKYPGGYSDYLANHERMPGIGPLAGWRGKDGDQHGKGEANPNQLEKYIENGCFWSHELDDNQRYYRHSNQDYLEYAKSMGWVPNTDAIAMQIYSEPLQKYRLAAEGHGAKQPPEQDRERVKTYFDPMPIWYMPFEEEQVDTDTYPLHAITQRPMHMYHSWGSQNAWLRQITNQNRLFINPETAAEIGVVDDDWVWVTSFHGKVKGQVKLMEGTNPHTVWTWNAIGKRKGAWGLADDAPEATKGFLLNHVISDLLPQKKDGYRYSNSDPITGQAAWYDLRVKVEKCGKDEIEETMPQFDPLPGNPGSPPSPTLNQYGKNLQGKQKGTHVEAVEHISNPNQNAKIIKDRGGK